MDNAILWLALGSTASLAGVAWQVWLALQDGIDSMPAFLAAKNALIADEVVYIRASVPRWRVIKRRQLLSAVEPSVRQALTAEELYAERRYDRSGSAWSLIGAGALVACLGSWLAVFVEQ